MHIATTTDTGCLQCHILEHRAP